MHTDNLFRQADTAYELGDFPSAFALFPRAAELGDCHAMTRLAIMYEEGYGTPPDVPKSIEWDLKAVAGGSRSSLSNLGLTYKKLGARDDAIKYLAQAFDDGDGEAAFELAKLYGREDSRSPQCLRYLDLAESAGDLLESTADEIHDLRCRLSRETRGIYD